VWLYTSDAFYALGRAPGTFLPAHFVSQAPPTLGAAPKSGICLLPHFSNICKLNYLHNFFKQISKLSRTFCRLLTVVTAESKLHSWSRQEKK